MLVLPFCLVEALRQVVYQGNDALAVSERPDQEARVVG